MAMAMAMGVRAPVFPRLVGLVAALLILPGCSPTPTPPPTTSISRPSDTPPLTPEPPPSPPELQLASSWQPNATQCKANEIESPQLPDTAALVRVCRPAAGTKPVYLRLVNLSNTTLILGVGTGRGETSYFAPHETELTQAALKEGNAVQGVSLQGDYFAKTGNLYLPARFSAKVVDNGELASVSIANFAAHGQAVSNVRAVSSLAGQLPYASLAKMPLLGAKVAGCALDAAQKANDDKITVKEAISLVKTCKQMVDDVRQNWRDYRAADVAAGKLPAAGLPQETEDLLRGIGRETGPVTSVWEDIARTFIKGFARSGGHL